MTIQTVFLHAAAERLDVEAGAARYALGLAAAFKAHLSAQVLDLNVVQPTGGRRHADAAAAAAVLRQAAAAHGVQATAVTERSHVHSTPEIAADHARLADLAVAGTHGQGLLSERMVAEALIFQAGRPVIIVPDAHRAPFAAQRVVVAWDFSRHAARALADALPFLRQAAATTLVSFGGDKDFASCLGPDDVVAALRRRGVNAQYRQVDRGGRDIGEAINAAAAEAQADLLVMGGFGHSRFRDFVLGGATRGILAAPRLPTLMSH